MMILIERLLKQKGVTQSEINSYYLQNREWGGIRIVCVCVCAHLK